MKPGHSGSLLTSLCCQLKYFNTAVIIQWKDLTCLLSEIQVVTSFCPGSVLTFINRALHVIIHSKHATVSRNTISIEVQKVLLCDS